MGRAGRCPDSTSSCGLAGPRSRCSSTRSCCPPCRTVVYVNADEVAKMYWPGTEAESRWSLPGSPRWSERRPNRYAGTLHRRDHSPTKPDLVRDAQAAGDRGHPHVLMIGETTRSRKSPGGSGKVGISCPRRRSAAANIGCGSTWRAHSGSATPRPSTATLARSSSWSPVVAAASRTLRPPGRPGHHPCRAASSPRASEDRTNW